MSDEATEAELDLYRQQREESKQRRAGNREHAMKLLREAGIGFTTANNGVHVVVAGRYDFWPGTGLWKVRGDKTKRRGVRALINRIKGAAK